MLSKTHLTLIFLALLLALFLPGSITLGPSYAQEEAAPGIPAPFFDWSDFRSAFGTRVFLMKLNAASFNFRDLQGTSFDVSVVNPNPPPAPATVNFGNAAFKNDPEPVPQFWGELYIDRLGIRAYYEEPMLRARADIPIINASAPPLTTTAAPSTQARIIELTLSSSRIGFDLDVIRRPYFRIGPDFDVHFSGIKYEEKYTQGIPGTTVQTVLGPATWQFVQLTPGGPGIPVLHSQMGFNFADSIVFTGQAPVTIGVHAKAIPGRIREVPITLQARVRFPVPFLDYFTKLGDVRVVDYEFSAGLRPVVWETSFIGHSTFSMSIEAGFRSISIETPMTIDIGRLSDAGQAYAGSTDGLLKDINFRGHWQGAFFQVVGFF
ncbi:MAG: hypothetical protein HY914_18915 [Desulfomonile tiedjei]|nr:hypothetical protein [Desulfomonile tiedjei]